MIPDPKLSTDGHAARIGLRCAVYRPWRLPVNRREHYTASFPGVIGEMVQPIIPAVLEARRSPGGTTLDAAVVANAKWVAVRLKTQSPVVQEAVRQNRLKIVAARYDLAAGHVDWFEDI